MHGSLRNVTEQALAGIGVSAFGFLVLIGLSLFGVSATAAIAYLTTPPWNWILMGFVFAAVVLGAAVLSEWQRRARAPATPAAVADASTRPQEIPPADPPQADLLGANAAYFFSMAREDLAGPSGTAKGVSVSTSARADLRRLDEGYAEFAFTFVNAAPFWVEVEEVAGRLVCGGAFERSPELTTRPGQGTTISHGESRAVVLRQRLSDREVAAVRAQIANDVLLIGLNELTIRVKLRMQGRPLQPVPNAPEIIRPISLPNFVRVRWPDPLISFGWP